MLATAGSAPSYETKTHIWLPQQNYSSRAEADRYRAPDRQPPPMTQRSEHTNMAAKDETGGVSLLREGRRNILDSRAGRGIPKMCVH